MRLHKIALPFLIAFYTSFSFAQKVGSSPYSAIGIGDIADVSFSRTDGMGGAGVGLHHAYQVNFINPAALSSIKYTNFEFGTIAKRNRLEDQSKGVTTASGNIKHFALSLPLHKRFVTQIGARPFSSVYYRDEDSRQINDKVFAYTRNNSGGLTEFFFGNAYNFKDWLRIGLRMSYLTGQSSEGLIQRDVANYEYYTLKSRTESYLVFSPGLLITRKLSHLVPTKTTSILDTTVLPDSLKKAKKLRVDIDEKTQWHVGVGVTGSFYNNLSATEDVFFQSSKYFSYYNEYQIVSRDTIRSGKVSASIPASMRFGLSLFKPDKITFALDYGLSNWSNRPAENFATFGVQHLVAIGTEFTPDYNSTKFYKRINYRAGVNAKTMPYQVAGQDISQWQVSLGAGSALPKTGVTINLSVAYGQRGTTDANLYKENYWLATLGVISNNKWFARPKHD